MKTSSIDFYAVLGVREDADTVVMRKAFRIRMRQVHPDRRPAEEASAAHEEMVLLNLAYETLSDPGKRAMYDLDRRAARNAKREQHREPPPPPKPRVIVLDPEVVDFGSVFIGEMPLDQVITVRFSDNSIIRYAWVLKDCGDFWQVVEPRPHRDVSAVRLRLRVRPLSTHDAPGPRRDRLRIMVDDLMMVVPVCINVMAAPSPPPPPPKPRAIVLNHRYINLGPVWVGGETQEQVVEARFDDGSLIGIARVLTPAGSFWHVTSQRSMRDTTCLTIRIKGGPVAPDRARGRFTERLQIQLDGITETVGVTAFITTPPAPPLTLANWRDFRLTCLGVIMLLSLLVLVGSLLFAGAYELLNAAPWGSNQGHHPSTTYAADLAVGPRWPDFQISAPPPTSPDGASNARTPRSPGPAEATRSPKLIQRAFDTACQQQYPGTAAKVGDPNDAYLWTCQFRQGLSVGARDLHGVLERGQLVGSDMQAAPRPS